jgi:hypothetical protein
MKLDNNIVLIFITALLVAIITSCCKDDPQTLNIWDSCTNPVAKDKNFRLGIWVQSPEYDPGLSKIKFVNDSIIDIYSGSSVQKWETNVKYKFDSCSAFKYLKYWIVQLPNALDYDIYRTSYNSTNNEWYLIQRERFPSSGVPPGWDTFRFKKQ